MHVCVIVNNNACIHFANVHTSEGYCPHTCVHIHVHTCSRYTKHWSVCSLRMINIYACKILQGEHIDYRGDPLADFTLMRFLDRFICKNPKQKPSDHGGSVMQRTTKLASDPGKEILGMCECTKAVLFPWRMYPHSTLSREREREGLVYVYGVTKLHVYTCMWCFLFLQQTPPSLHQWTSQRWEWKSCSCTGEEQYENWESFKCSYFLSFCATSSGMYMYWVCTGLFPPSHY